MMTDQQVRAIAEKVLKERLAPFGLDRVEVRSGTDHEGDPAIYITAVYRRSAPKLNPRAALDAMNEVARKLGEHGDDRFAYLNSRYPGDLGENPTPRRPKRVHRG